MNKPTNLSKNRAEEIFDAARALASEAERDRYLAMACGEDEALRQRIRGLLKAEAAALEFFNTKEPLAAEQSDSSKTIRVDVPLSEGPGTVIGRYRLLEKIGEGGFGAIYVAEQKVPVRRRVALKIIKLGMDTRQVVARFEAERQALALMDHPNIAKVLDAGATDSGRPYFVMELVRGIAITQYCDQGHLSLVERLKLFTQVCHAIQHAHQKGIIHRDIKPSNILVTLHDGVPVPKVIDFGIAKATQGDLTDKTNYTQFEQFIGTPAYMSPEQAEMSGLDIDTRSDIYALGVLLYELLVGKTPFEARDLLQVGLDKMRRTIREQEPVRPSTRLGGLTGEESTTTANRRGLEMHRLIAMLRGDLDWIVMKCLEKDRTRRYETANGLAMDIQRHLNHEPVVARPPSRLYRFQKLVWRNKLAFGAAAAVVISLIVGFAFSTWQYLEKNQAYHRAVAAEQAQNRLRVRAEASELSARQHLYVADMLLAEQALGVGNLGRTLELLQKYQANDALRSLRGWEWRHLWRECRSDELFQMGRHSNVVTTVAFSPDGNTLASGGHDRVVKLWDVAKRREIGSLAHEDSVLSLAFSEDGKTLVTVATSQGVTLWDVATRRELFRPQLGRLSFNTCGDSKSIVFSPTNPQLLAIGDQDGKITILNVTTRAKLLELPGITNRAYHILAFSPDGQTLAGGAPGMKSILMWNAATGQLKARFDLGSLALGACLAFSPDGRLLATYLQDRANDIVALLDATTGKIRSSHTNHTWWISSVRFSPDGKILASAGDHTIRLWDVESWGETAVLRGHLQEVWSLAFSPDGKTLASGSKDETVKLWSVTRRAEESQNLPLDGAESSVSPDGRVFATRDQKNTITMVNPRNLEEIGSYRIPVSNLTAWTLGPGGVLVAIGEHDGQIKLWSLAGKTLTASFHGHDGEVEWLKFSNDGGVLISVGKDQTIKLWQVMSQKQLGQLAAPHREVTALRLSADGATLAMGFMAEKDPNGLAKLWNLTAMRAIAVLPPHQQRVAGLAFAPDGKTLATASFDGTAKLWDLATLQCKEVLKGGKLYVSSMCLSPDGRRLALGGDNTNIKIWDMTTSQEVASLKVGSGAKMIEAVFFADDDTLFAYNWNQAAHIWHAASFAESDGQRD